MPIVSRGKLGPTAIAWAEAGWKIFPLRRLSKLPHHVLGRGWSYFEGPNFVGSSNPEWARKFWRGDDSANIGLITGMANRLLVIDCDRHNGVWGWDTSVTTEANWERALQLRDGVTIFGAWAEQNGVDLSEVPQVWTPSGGVHYWWRLDEPMGKRDGWLPGVDVKADGTYIAAPPSEKWDGVGGASGIFRYRWAIPPTGPLQEPPKALLEALGESGLRLQTFGSDADPRGDLPKLWWFKENGFQPGRRNDQCFRLACRLHGAMGMTHEEVRKEIREVWERTSQHPDRFPWSEAEACIRQALRFPAEHISDWRG